MSSGNIIEIQNLVCSYTQRVEDKVLYVENLNIPKGQITFLIGASGSGKSTLLETLGLMNQTIVSGSVKLKIHDQAEVDFNSLWKQGDPEALSRIRKNFLSFIFQNTNLMDNFTAYENICLSNMIKSNSSQADAMEGARNLMKQVGLPIEEVGTEKLSVNLSGGQRQRVSFVRALNNNFSVLLCDEPTGNLDESNADELLNIVKKNLNESRTAIIVSHDIGLALKYADTIVLITKNESNGCGEILLKNIFERTSWESMSSNEQVDFRSDLALNFKSPDLKSMPALGANGAKDSFQKISYRSLFNVKEGRVLFGKQRLNLFILISILSITFMAIGFANGALEYLDRKYKDPFVRLLSVEIPWTQSSASRVQQITDQINELQVRDHYKIDTVTAFRQARLRFFNNHEGVPEPIKGRMISVHDRINDYIFDSRNVVSGDTTFKNEIDLGIVVTSRTLQRLGYSQDAKVIYLDNDDMDTTLGKSQLFKVPIPIRSVVKEIPGKNSFMASNFFFASYLNSENCVFDFRTQRQRILFFVDGDRELAIQFGKDIIQCCKNLTIDEKIPVISNDIDISGLNEDDLESYEPSFFAEADTKVRENPLTGNVSGNDATTFEIKKYEVDVRYSDTCEVMSSGGYEISVNLNAIPQFYTTTENIYRNIIELDTYKKNNKRIYRIFDYVNAPQVEEEFSNDYLSVIFKEEGLDSISNFAKYVFTNLNSANIKDQSSIMEVDQGAVQEKNNFNYISKMTRLISGLLIVFSILCISLFISNLLKTHLNKVKMNLGTFKAFGLSDKESVNIYMGIMIRFILIGLAVSLVVAFGLGNLVGIWFKNWLNIEDQVEYFQLFAGQTYFLIFIILVVTAITSYMNINRILSKTPGDLIYNR